ncbi:MAG: hypothetical protein BroJett042_21400 [Bacteroidota bacterium]|nr:MAG: hypothetical protein UZ12_BCD005001937 [Bacteroidetes bacterium OLB12]GIL23627.1 MAG: hypothetical protein BroJett042_21400 [Bacteroidota bacterium]HNR74224.1 hypothetical protein [Cyclobacteriaceae bacterium]
MTRILFIAFLFVPLVAHPQKDFVKLKSWKAKKTERITVDRLGNFLLIEKSGRIIRYNPDGKKIATSKKQPYTLIEPWFQPTIFVYDRTRQQYNLLDRNFETNSTHHVDAAWAIEPWLVCPTHDNRLWILDRADWSLKKVQPTTNQVIQEFNLPVEVSDKADFIYLREYLNLIFLLDKNAGILILNHLGQLIERIEVPDLKGFYFFGDEMYFVQNNNLKYFNLLTSQWRAHAIPANSVQAIITDERLITFSPDKEATLYKYTLE